MAELLCFLGTHPLEHEPVPVKKMDGRVVTECKACCEHPAIWHEP